MAMYVSMQDVVPPAGKYAVMEIAIRRLGPGDEKVLAGIAAEADDFDLPGRSEPEPPLAPADAAAYLTDAHVLHWVGEQDGLVVGELLCHVLLLPSGAGRELLLYAVGVRNAHRRRGIGRALIHHMLRWCDAAGIPVVWVLADNLDAEAFYVACGFRRGAANEQGVLLLREVGGAAEPEAAAALPEEPLI
jgi:putative acetyltransferase